VFKQMRILHGKDFSPAEREAMGEVIHQTILAQMQVLVEMSEELGCPIVDREAVELFHKLDPSVFDAATAAVIKRLWSDPGIKSTYEMRSRFQLNDSAA
jgi:guanine nucleotide-binding protein G(i) subunit alpha